MRNDPFLKQFERLKKTIPLPTSRGQDLENSDYGNYLYSCKNLYYSFDSTDCSDSFYLFDCYKMENCMDSNFSAFCENSYEVSDSVTCYNCFYMAFCGDCYDCYFCINCEGCHDCFGCANLEHKQYCIYNIQYTKEKYFEKIKKLKKESTDKILNKVDILEKSYPKIYSHSMSNENSDYGDYLYKSSNSYFSFNCDSINDCGYQFDSYESNDCWDGTRIFRCEQCYEATDATDCYNSRFIDKCERCYDSTYLYECKDCHDCFGCVGLQHKEYCILNKQYTEKNYLKKTAEIKKNLGWGLKIGN